MLRGILRGAAAGAAGATALNATTYLDMVVRGRAASDAPKEMVQSLTERVGVQVPGEDGARENRLSGLGALSGIATGVVVGAVYGGLQALGFRAPPVPGAILPAAAAMAVSDLSMTVLGVTDPRTWSPKSWASDIVPHLAYGALTYATLNALDRPAR